MADAVLFTPFHLKGLTLPGEAEGAAA